MATEPQLPIEEVSPSRPGRSRAAPIAVVVILVVVPLVIFGPLLAALFEERVFHTHHVEEFCRQIGIYDEPGAIYQPMIEFFEQFWK